MYKFLLVLLSAMGMAGIAHAKSKQSIDMELTGKKVLVAYFSATGTTARVAVADVVKGELYAIVPAQPYTNADLDWNDKQSRSSIEMNDPKSRPAIKGRKENITDCDVIFLGYPIWWDLAPRVINTFIETHDLKGKTVIPFATSGGSGIANSVTVLKKEYPELDWKQGRLLNRFDENAVREWIEK